MSDIEYKKLLAEVLGRVDEKFNLDITGAELPAPPFNKNKRKQPAIKTAAKKTAEITPDDSKLTDTDFESIFKTLKEPELTAARTTMNAMIRNDDDAAEIRRIYRDTQPDRDRLKAALIAAKKQKEADRVAAAEKEVEDVIASGFQDVVDTEDDSELAGLAEPDLSSVRSSARFKDLSAEGFTKFEDGTFSVTAPESVRDQFAAIDGKGLLEKFNNLAAFGKALEGGEAGVKNWLDSKTQGEDAISAKQAELKFMNYAPAYVTFADMAKHLGGSEAGFALEKYLALLLNSPILGGSNGAADNVSRIASGDPVFFSAKFYDAKGIKSIGQSMSGAEGVRALVRKQGRPIYYVVLTKTKALDAAKGQYSGKDDAGGSMTNRYDTIVMFLARLSYENDEYRVDLINPDGKVIKSYVPKYDSSHISLFDDGTGAGATTIMSDITQYGGFVLPAPVQTPSSADVDRLSQFTNRYVLKLIDDLGNDMISKIKGIYQDIEKTKSNTRSYVAKKSDAKDASTHVSAISKSYSDLFNRYQFLLGDETGAADDNVFKNVGISEIKTLTKNILKEMLDDE